MGNTSRRAYKYRFYPTPEQEGLLTVAQNDNFRYGIITYKEGLKLSFPRQVSVVAGVTVGQPGVSQVTNNASNKTMTLTVRSCHITSNGYCFARLVVQGLSTIKHWNFARNPGKKIKLTYHSRIRAGC